MRVLYLIPGASFFKEKWGGRTAHVMGVVEGLTSIAVLSVFGGKGVKDLLGSQVVSKEFTRIVVPRQLFMLFYVGRQYDVLIVRKTFVFMVLTLLFPRSFRRRIVWEVNGLSNWGAVISNSFFEKLIYLIHRGVLNSSRAIYVITPTLKDKLIGIGLSHSKIIVVPNGIPSNSLKSTWVAKSAYSLLFFGVLRQYNDWSLLNEILSKNSSLNLDVFGYHLGNDHLELDFQKENIFNHGKSAPKDIIEYIKSSSSNFIGLVPMKDVEDSRLGSPIKLYDYISFGIPVIVSSATYLDDMLQNSPLIEVYDTRGGVNSLKTSIECMVERLNSFSAEELQNEFIKLQVNLSWKSRMIYLLDEIT